MYQVMLIIYYITLSANMQTNVGKLKVKQDGESGILLYFAHHFNSLIFLKLELLGKAMFLLLLRRKGIK